MLTGYTTRKKITINHNLIDEDLINFPIRIFINNDEDIGKYTKFNGDDIRFTSNNGKTELKYEIEDFVINNGLAIGNFWVKIPFISSLEDTIIYIYYGNFAANKSENSINVWDNNYLMVLHMNDNNITIIDSTLYERNGTKKNVNEPNKVDAKIGKGQEFDGIDDYVIIPKNFGIFGGNKSYTVSLWILFNNIIDNDGETLISFRGEHDIYWTMNLNGEPNLEIRRRNINNNWNKIIGSGTLNIEQWYHFIQTYDNTNNQWKLYQNGLLIDSNINADIIGEDNLDNSTIGNRPGQNRYFDGIIDEVRVSNIIRSPAWIKTEYHSENNTLITISNELLVGYKYKKFITINHNLIDEDLINFPIRIYIDNDNNIGTVAKNNGDDIKFTISDEETILKYEIEDFTIINNNAIGNFWVKIPFISSIEDTIIYIHYGNISSNESQNYINVWNNNFQGVWHLNNINIIKDSTFNNFSNASIIGNIISHSDGKIGNSIDFGNGENYIDFGINAGDLDIDGNKPRTIEIWCFIRDFIDNEGIFSLGTTGSNSNDYSLRVRAGNINNFRAQFWGTGVDIDFSYDSHNKWVKFVFTYDGTEQIIYADGIEIQKATRNFNTSTNDNLHIAFWDNVNRGTLNGILDELRISNIVRSPAWIKASYHSENNDLINISSEIKKRVFTKINKII
jgi:hypothetical protein